MRIQQALKEKRQQFEKWWRNEEKNEALFDGRLRRMQAWADQARHYVRARGGLYPGGTAGRPLYSKTSLR